MIKSGCAQKNHPYIEMGAVLAERVEIRSWMRGIINLCIIMKYKDLLIRIMDRRGYVRYDELPIIELSNNRDYCEIIKKYPRDTNNINHIQVVQPRNSIK